LEQRQLWIQHLHLTSTYLQLAIKYMYINPQIHHLYYLKHLDHASEMEKNFFAIEQ
jgi:hypothetical protein